MNNSLKKLNEQKLLSYGFVKEEDGYSYITDIMDGQFVLSVKVTFNGELISKIYDKEFEEDYVLHLVPDAVGAFVTAVKSEYEKSISDIYENCFDNNVFKTDYATKVIDYIKLKYGNEPEFLWEKFPDNAIFRRTDNNKWYGAILTVDKGKILPDAFGRVEIIDLKIHPDNLKKLVDNKKFFTGYHMNKKQWITIILDGSVPIEVIYKLVDDSYILAKNKK